MIEIIAIVVTLFLMYLVTSASADSNMRRIRREELEKNNQILLHKIRDQIARKDKKIDELIEQTKENKNKNKRMGRNRKRFLRH